MKIATKKETIEIIKALVAGTLKPLLCKMNLDYHAAMMRVYHFKKSYPKEYKSLVKHFVNIC